MSSQNQGNLQGLQLEPLDMNKSRVLQPITNQILNGKGIDLNQEQNYQLPDATSHQKNTELQSKYLQLSPLMSTKYSKPLKLQNQVYQNSSLESLPTLKNMSQFQFGMINEIVGQNNKFESKFQSINQDNELLSRELFLPNFKKNYQQRKPSNNLPPLATRNELQTIQEIEQPPKPKKNSKKKNSSKILSYSTIDQEDLTSSIKNQVQQQASDFDNKQKSKEYEMQNPQNHTKRQKLSVIVQDFNSQRHSIIENLPQINSRSPQQQQLQQNGTGIFNIENKPKIQVDLSPIEIFEEKLPVTTKRQKEITTTAKGSSKNLQIKLENLSVRQSMENLKLPKKGIRHNSIDNTELPSQSTMFPII
eukprot:403346295